MAHQPFVLFEATFVTTFISKEIYIEYIRQYILYMCIIFSFYLFCER